MPYVILTAFPHPPVETMTDDRIQQHLANPVGFGEILRLFRCRTRRDFSLNVFRCPRPLFHGTTLQEGIRLPLQQAQHRCQRP